MGKPNIENQERARCVDLELGKRSGLEKNRSCKFRVDTCKVPHCLSWNTYVPYISKEQSKVSDLVSK